MVIKTLKRYWGRQFSQVKEEGVEAIWSKMMTVNRRFIIFLLSLSVIPIVLVIRVIQPWYWIRFGWFFGSRIGHFAFDVEYYLTEKKLGLHHNRVKDIFFYQWGKPANHFFSKLIERHLVIRNWVEPLFVANDMIPGGTKHELLPCYEKYASRDLDGLFTKTSTQLSFTDNENLNGYDYLHSIGMDNKEKFICLIVRDSAYLNDPKYSYHNYRDSNIDKYKDASIYLAEKGYWVFRMGKKVHNPFVVNNDRIIDYASSEQRSDFLDIWLMANCYFCISTGLGIDEVARVFRKPALNVNYLPASHIVSYSHCISLLKNLKWKKTNKPLTFSEYLRHSYLESDKYINNEITIKELSSKDIYLAVYEMERKLQNKWKSEEEDEELIRRYWSIFRSNKKFNLYHNFVHPESELSVTFLRNNSEFLK